MAPEPNLNSLLQLDVHRQLTLAAADAITEAGEREEAEAMDRQARTSIWDR
jgi:hypothetical protein